MFFHGYEVFVGDRVYDISAGRGFGEVTRVYDNSFEVKFPKYRLIYDGRGVQKGKNTTTLFWHVPVIIKPLKHEQQWNRKQHLLDSILGLIEEFDKDFKDNL